MDPLQYYEIEKGSLRKRNNSEISMLIQQALLITSIENISGESFSPSWLTADGNINPYDITYGKQQLPDINQQIPVSFLFSWCEI